MSGPRETTQILFVCLGNICRSPAAEGIFLHRARERGVAERFRVDSAALGPWHAGERPDPRTIAEAQRRGIHLPSIARQIRAEDFERFDLIVYMDAQNRAGLLKRGAPEAKMRAMGSFAAGAGAGAGTARGAGAGAHAHAHAEVADPYEHGPEAFERMFDHLEELVAGMLAELAPARG
ncbi:MAG: low molecular weight protein-tyrosine-phosphatase [Phycisphaerales bacterium]